MPNTKSAKKNLRSDIERRLRNRIRKSRMRTCETALTAKVAAGEVEAAKAALTACFSELDKAAKTGTIHKNTADRKKQRLAARVTAMA